MPKVYLHLTTALKNTIDQWKQLVDDGKYSPDEYNNAILEVYNKIQYFKSEIEKIPTGPERAKFVHILIDEIIQKDQKKSRENNLWPEVKCQKGCAHCCYQTVDLTTDEGDLLAAAVRDGTLKINMEHLERQSKESADADSFSRLPLDQKKCVFLGVNNECMAYEQRPTACRKYFVVSDPLLCADEINTTVLVLSVNTAELVASAALDLSHESMDDNLPRLLYKKLKK